MASGLQLSNFRLGLQWAGHLGPRASALESISGQLSARSIAHGEEYLVESMWNPYEQKL